ncbi:MAG: helix-turn-helix domain-containing protein, partial [Eubacterium sp.]|nr:helix-turn-helix domain-containing protein [Candidatus Colimonas fimequi]
MNIEQMKARKQELGYSYEMIARMAGVSIATVKKIFGGEVQSPRYDTLQKLESVFSQPLPSKVREVEFKYDVSDHSYTAEDYNTFPEYAAIEIVNGKIYPKYPSDKPKESRYKSMTFHQLASDTKNGSYTYEDYEGFPGDLRVEIVRGYIYALAAANTAHQLICGDLHVQIYGYIKANGGQCVVGQAPYDVCLFEDGLTTVQPDVYVV